MTNDIQLTRKELKSLLKIWCEDFNVPEIPLYFSRRRLLKSGTVLACYESRRPDLFTPNASELDGIVTIGFSFSEPMKVARRNFRFAKMGCKVKTVRHEFLHYIRDIDRIHYYAKPSRSASDTIKEEKIIRKLQVKDMDEIARIRANGWKGWE